MEKTSRILIAGASGLVGSAICRLLTSKGYHNVLVPRSAELDLRNSAKVSTYFHAYKPEFVFLCAAKVGGILANKREPASFILDNLKIQNSVIEWSHRARVEKLIFLGSSCIYPKDAKQPIKEEYLLTGQLEDTNRAYAIAKIAGIETCQAYNRQYGCNFVSVMPTNLYGPNDNFNLESSHLLPALIRKFEEAKANGHAPVTLWGTGQPFRELLHVDDLAEALLTIMNHYDGPEPINVGSGTDLRVSQIAELVRYVVGHEGDIIWDKEKPDGTPRKLLETSKIRSLGWKPRIDLEDGVRHTWEWWNKAKQENTVRI